MLNIAFPMSDPRPGHWHPNDPFHIIGFISQNHVKHVDIDNGTIMLHLQQQGPLVGFTGHGIWPTGTIMLPFTLVSHDGTKQVTRVLEFLVFDYVAEHNILLGRPTLFQLQVIPSTLHGIIKFSTSDGSATVVATRPDNECSTQQETKQETKSCRSESFQKVENPHRRSATKQMLVHESRKRQRDVFRRLTTSLPWKEANDDPNMSSQSTE
uniref:Uncharacterized protein n=1 Tax=Lactuca sativa TaxID=4236 RepID=A0A9R1WIT2_LACSA|nr:hypothetical protein LSAT_V11C100030900 [Lactuca sativa]